MSKHPCYDTCFSTKTAYKVCSFRLMYFYTFRIFVILYYHQYIHVEGVLHWNNNSLCSFSLHFLLLLDVKFGCTRNKSSHAYLSIYLSVTDLNTSLRGLALFRFLFFFFLKKKKKNRKPELSYILTGLFNMCFKESCFPDF